jgi:hypothetical protein
MAWTQADVDALEASIAQGLGAGQMVLEGQSVTFASIDDRLKLLSVMRRAVTTAGGTQSTRYAATSKGV